jgi:hypothetical protein
MLLLAGIAPVQDEPFILNTTRLPCYSYRMMMLTRLNANTVFFPSTGLREKLILTERNDRWCTTARCYTTYGRN